MKETLVCVTRIRAIAIEENSSVCVQTMLMKNTQCVTRIKRAYISITACTCDLSNFNMEIILDSNVIDYVCDE